MAEAKLRLDHLEKNFEKLSKDVQNIYEKGCKYQMGDACSKLEAEINKIKEKGCGKAAIHELRMNTMEELMQQNISRAEAQFSKNDETLKEMKLAMADNRDKLQKSREQSLRNNIYMEGIRAFFWLLVVGATGTLFYWIR